MLWKGSALLWSPAIPSSCILISPSLVRSKGIIWPEGFLSAERNGVLGLWILRISEVLKDLPVGWQASSL